MTGLPNLLSALRLLLAPVIAWMLIRGHYGGALAIVFVAGISDGLDGYLARRLQSTSRLGAWLDPVADKVLLGTVYLSLGVAGALPWWLVWMVLGRDVLILAAAGAAFLWTRRRDFPPSVWGKVSTLVQISTALVFIADRVAVWLPTGQLEPVLVAVTAATTAWSGVHYFWLALVRGR